MWRAAARVLLHRRATAFWGPRAGHLLCLTVFGVMMLIFLANNPVPHCRHRGRSTASTPEIPFKARASAYRQKARFVIALPHGERSADVKADLQDTLAISLLQRQPSRSVQTRARRQEALEEEIERYLVTHDIHRKRRTRVRFLIAANRVDWDLCTALGSAALAGFSVPVTGFDEPYSHLGRYKKYVEFVEREGLDDDDIVVLMDGDVFWTGADLLPFLSKFARFSPGTEADLDVAAVRAWEDYGEKKAPLFMKELQAQADGTGGAHKKRPAMQMAPMIINGEQYCYWGQHTKGFLGCGLAYTVMDHLIEVARNHVSSYDMNKNIVFIAKTRERVRQDLAKAFPGDRRWMMDDVLRQPNASSPYTTKAQRDPSDPLFYHPSVAGEVNPTTVLNGGLQVSRVWALRRYAQMMNVFMTVEQPLTPLGTSEWVCDQGMLGELYTRARLFEVQHNLLSGPPPSARTPPVQYDPRFGPPGLIGIERRSEMAAFAYMLEDSTKVLHHSAYLNEHFPARRGSGANVKEARRGSDNPNEKRLATLSATRGGALVTPPLLWRSGTQDDRAKGYVNTAEDDPDVVHPAFIHYAGGAKMRRFTAQRHLFSWLVAARHDRRARQALNNTLREELVELWYEKERVYVDYLRMCKDPTLLPLS